MKIEQKYMMKYLEMAALEQLTDKYLSDGYTCIVQKESSSFQADAIFQKDNSIIIIELVAGIQNRDKLAQKLNNIKSFSKKEYLDHTVKLEIIPIIPHREIIVNVEGLEEALLNIIENDYTDIFNEICTHFHAESVSDIEFSEVIIGEPGTNLIGTATIDMVLQYGSNGDVRRGDGHVWKDSFPVQFDIFYDGHEITEINDIKIALSTDYDDPRNPDIDEL